MFKGGGSGLKIVETLFWDNSWPTRYKEWNNFLTGFWDPRPYGATLAATPIFQAKIPKWQKSSIDMIYGAHLIALVVLSSGIFWNTILDEKWLRYRQKTYAHIWAYGPNLILNDPQIGQIWIIFYETNFPPYILPICIFSVIYSSKSLKMSNSGPKNLQKNTKSSISQFAILLRRASLKIYLLLHFSFNRLEIFRSCS